MFLRWNVEKVQIKPHIFKRAHGTLWDLFPTLMLERYKLNLIFLRELMTERKPIYAKASRSFLFLSLEKMCVTPKFQITVL